MFDRSEFLRTVDTWDFGVLMFIGRGKSFKTGSYVQLFDYCPRLQARPKAFVGIPSIDHIPSRLNPCLRQSLLDLQVGEAGIMDDFSIHYASRDKNLELQRITALISHKDNLLIGTCQNTSNVDQCIFRDQRNILAFKLTDPLAIKYERTEIQPYCQLANKRIKAKAKETGLNVFLFTFIPLFDELLYLPDVPEWYDKRHSHAHRDTKVNAKGLVF